MEKAQIKWACRRGMLELDLFLGPYFENCYDSLSESEKNNFIDLLGCEDTYLFAWLMGHEAPEEKYKNMVEGIIHYAKTRPRD